MIEGNDKLKQYAAKDGLTMLAFVAVTFAVSAIGSAVTLPQIPNWYYAIAKPAWTPPDGVFGPVWGALYFMMALAAWLVWLKAGWRGARVPLALYVLQLALNLGWTLLFFGAHWLIGASLEIIVLWLAILATQRAFRVHSLAAAWLLIPYLVWVAYAATITWGVAWLN